MLAEIREDGEYGLSSLSSRKSLAVSRVSNSGKHSLKDCVHRYRVLAAPEGLGQQPQQQVGAEGYCLLLPVCLCCWLFLNYVIFFF